MPVIEKQVSRAEDIRYLALGVVAALLYGSVVFSLLFAMPLQTAWTRGGFRPFLIALATAMIGTAAWLAWQYRGIASIEPSGYILMLTLPAGLAVAMAAANAGFLASWPLVYRILPGTAIVAAAAAPTVYALFTNAEIQEYLLRAIGALAESLEPAGGEGYSGSVFRASLQPEILLDTARRLIADGYAAVIYGFTFLAYWAGIRAAGPDANESRRMPRLSQFRLPAGLIWVFLGCWATVMALRIPGPAFTGSRLLQAAAWNLALTVTFCYAAQGLGIFRHFTERFAPAGPLRWMGTLFVVILLANIATGVWTAGFLSVLGATETWIPYRYSKGVQA
ncbi:MAG TPA: hypothetical protein VLH39_05900 [Magnetospirillaceae bacterium]|nr:hypothetical protein [Magnetospirillaceae bacterium]